MADSVTIQGVDQLVSGLDRAESALGSWQATNLAAARLLAGAGARYAPRRSGRLAGSHHPLATETAAEVEVTESYAGPIRYGVGPRVGMRGPHNIVARDWLGEAVDATRDQVESLYEARVSNIVRDIP